MGSKFKILSYGNNIVALRTCFNPIMRNFFYGNYLKDPIGNNYVILDFSLN